MSNNRNYPSNRNVRLYTNKQNSKSIVKKFVDEFGYEAMYHECSINKKSIIIEESTIEIVYELESFSRKHLNHEFVIEYVNGKHSKISKTVRLEAGSTLEVIENSPQHKNKNQDSQKQPLKKQNVQQQKPKNQNKPQTNKSQPNRKFQKKDNNSFQKQRNQHNHSQVKDSPVVENKTLVIEDVTQKKQSTRNLKFNNNAA